MARLSPFGSFARDEGRDDSDVDLLVEFNRPVGLFEFVRLQRQLAEIVGHPVDLVTPAALRPQRRDRILREAVIAAEVEALVSQQPVVSANPDRGIGIFYNGRGMLSAAGWNFLPRDRVSS